MDTDCAEKAQPLSQKPQLDFCTKRWGIFDVFYDRLSFRTTVGSILIDLVSSLSSLHVKRAFYDLFSISPLFFGAYLLLEFLFALTPFLSLLLASTVLQNFNTSSVDPQCDTVNQSLACAWLLLEILQPLTERANFALECKLGGATRSHFLPTMAKASLKMSLSQGQSLIRLLPSSLANDHEERNELPADWCSMYNPPLLCHVRDLLSETGRRMSIILQLGYLLYLACISDILDVAMRGYLGALLFFSLVKPMNTAGGTGFTFWTESIDFHRLNDLHSVIFGQEYHETLTKNAAQNTVLEEYRRALNDLGALDATPLQVLQFDSAWVWNSTRAAMLDSSFALAILLLLLRSPGITFANVIFTCYGGEKIRRCSTVLGNCDAFSIPHTLQSLAQFYRALAQGEDDTTNQQEPHVEEGDHLCTKSSFDNEKGFSLSPTPSSPADVDSGECLLPMTIAENIMIGGGNNSTSENRYLKVLEVARYAGCLELHLEHGNAVVGSCSSILCRSGPQAGAIGPNSRAVLEEKEHSIKRYMPSEEERQKILAARAFMKFLSANPESLNSDLALFCNFGNVNPAS